MQEIIEYTIENDIYKLKFLNIGAVITEYSIKGHNIVLRFEDLESYRDNYLNLGSVVGRNAGRIKDGKIDGWQLPLNQDGKHTLHGGRTFQYNFYDVTISENVATLKCVDPEGTFPGNVNVEIKYTLTDEGLVQEFTANSDKPTILDFTNHSYFNLNPGNDILSSKLLIETAEVKELDEDLLPVGNLEVKGSAFDFNVSRKISDSLKQGHDQFKYSKFIDHPFRIDGQVKLENDNHSLEIKTDQNYLVVYAGNFIGTEELRLENSPNLDYHGICLETQNLPGTTNMVTEYYAITKFILNEK